MVRDEPNDEVFEWLAEGLRAYPSRPAERYVIQAQTKCNMPK
jgi:hypothetical protein